MIDDKTALGLFKTRDEAESAVQALLDAGFTSEQIGFLGAGETQEPPAGQTAARGVATGTAVGGTTGGVLGVLATGLIPGIGPVAAGGILIPLVIAIATGAAAGGVAGGLLSGAAVGTRGLYYEQQVEAGSSLVAVDAGPRSAEAEAIMKEHGSFGEAPLP